MPCPPRLQRSRTLGTKISPRTDRRSTCLTREDLATLCTASTDELTSHPLGGTYSAPLALNVKLVFTPVSGDASGRRELTRRIDLGPGNHSVWAYVTEPRYAQGVRIDTNGDGRPDTLLPGPSNFRAGIEPAVLHGEDLRSRATPAAMCYISMSCPAGQCPYQSCHCDPNATDPYHSSDGCDHLHCIWTCVTQSCCTSQQ
jgi:hypothetical protein